MQKTACKILVIDEAHEILKQKLKEHELHYKPHISLDELEEVIGEYEILILRTKLKFDKSWIDRAKKLKIIARLGSGLDNIDVAYAESKGMVCLNAPEGNRRAVAEQCIGMMISMLANVSRSHRALLKGKWNRAENSGIELNERTVGIIGFGNVGSTLAQLLAGFGCRVLAYDLHRKGFGDSEVKEVSLETLKKEADIISLHVPLNPNSHQMINESFFKEIDHPIFLLNLSRGDVVETEALVNALRSGKLKGLALDVYEQEKLDQLTPIQRQHLDELLSNPDVIMTPHTAGLTQESFRKLAEVLADKVLLTVSNFSFC